MKSKVIKFGLFSRPTIKDFEEFIKVYGDIVFEYEGFFDTLTVPFIDTLNLEDIGIALDNFIDSNADRYVRGYYILDSKEIHVLI